MDRLCILLERLCGVAGVKSRRKFDVCCGRTEQAVDGSCEKLEVQVRVGWHGGDTRPESSQNPGEVNIEDRKGNKR
jgi:hypothetical protein